MAKALENGGRKTLISPYQVREQIKMLMIMSGGAFISEKAFKAAYAILQSNAPDDFPLDWDALFFSIYSRTIHDELSHLVLEKGEVLEAIWRGGVEPLHHIYFLRERERRASQKAAYEAYDNMPYWVDFLLWSILPPKFPVYWSYLLEMYSYENLDKKAKESIPYLPLLKDELDRKKKTKLRKLLYELREQLTELAIQPLKISRLSTTEDNNLYIFLPFEMDSIRRTKLLNFYGAYRFTGFVSVSKTNEEEVLEVQINPEGIPSIYDYIRLEKQDILSEHERLDIYTYEFDQWLEYHMSRMCHRIPPNKDCYCAYYFIEEYARKRQEFFSQLPQKVKEAAVVKGQQLLKMLCSYYELAQWRFDHIMQTLMKLAKISQDSPIRLRCKSVEMEAYGYETVAEKHTLVGFEFSEDFLRIYRKKFKYGLPSGNLHHIYHFVQPEEVLKSINMGKEQSLLHGGPILGEY